MGNITLKQVTKNFDGHEVIKPLDLSIDNGEFVVFVGPSGCGKSTMLRMIAGLEDVSSGTIEIDGQDATETPPAKRGLAMVFQSYALYPHMSVRSNIAFPLKRAKMDESLIQDKVTKVAETLNLTPYLDRRPGQLDPVLLLQGKCHFSPMLCAIPPTPPYIVRSALWDSATF